MSGWIVVQQNNNINNNNNNNNNLDLTYRNKCFCKLHDYEFIEIPSQSPDFNFLNLYIEILSKSLYGILILFENCLVVNNYLGIHDIINNEKLNYINWNNPILIDNSAVIIKKNAANNKLLKNIKYQYQYQYKSLFPLVNINFFVSDSANWILKNPFQMFNVDSNTKIYYINLDDNIERKLDLETQLIKYNFINFERIPAVDTRTFEKIDQFKDIIHPVAYYKLLKHSMINKNRDKHRELQKGAVGCFLSHMAIYHNMIENNIPYAIILEDDCKIDQSPKNFSSLITVINKNIPHDTDLFFYDAQIHEMDTSNSKNNNTKIYPLNFFFGTHFYLITLQGAKKLVENLDCIEYQIDSEISMLSFAKILKTYVYTGMRIAKQNNKFSTEIQNMSCKKCNVFKEIKEMKFIAQEKYGQKI